MTKVEKPSEAEAAAWDRGSGTALRTEWLASLLVARCQRGWCTLELAAGTGALVSALLRREIDAYGIEDDPLLLARAVNAAPGRVIRGEARHVPMRSQRFDAVLAVSPRAIPPQPTFVIGEVRRLLTSNGVCLVALPDPDPPLDDEIRRILTPMRQALRTRLQPPTIVDIARIAGSQGLNATTERIPPHSFQQSPTKEAADLRARSSSLLWGLDDRDWREIVLPTIARLESLREPGRPRHRRAYYTLLTMTPRGDNDG